ncbi:MAG: hypothetical protein ACR2GR_10040 [Rhodothermales bacterium]
MNLSKHLDVLGYLYLALGALGALGALIVFVAVVGGGALSGDQDAIFVTTTVGIVISLLIWALSLPSLLAGYGLLKRRSWARVLTLVLGFLNLFNLPFGTALGIYSFWVLLKDEAPAYFTGTAA